MQKPFSPTERPRPPQTSQLSAMHCLTFLQRIRRSLTAPANTFTSRSHSPPHAGCDFFFFLLFFPSLGRLKSFQISSHSLDESLWLVLYMQMWEQKQAVIHGVSIMASLPKQFPLPKSYLLKNLIRPLLRYEYGKWISCVGQQRCASPKGKLK